MAFLWEEETRRIASLQTWHRHSASETSLAGRPTLKYCQRQIYDNKNYFPNFWKRKSTLLVHFYNKVLISNSEAAQVGGGAHGQRGGGDEVSIFL